MTSETGDVFCLNNDKNSTVSEAEYFERVVCEFLTSSLRQNTSMAVRLKSCMEEIRRIYSKGLDYSARPDWSDECYQCTYVYRFFAMHSYMVYRSLQSALADKEHIKGTWKQKLSFRVCCIGGGPGSDALGLTKFLRDTQLVPTNRLECTIFDLRQEWENTWKMITQSNSSDEFPTMTYFSGDMTRTASGLNIDEMEKVRAADVISVVKFFSTVSAFISADATRGNLLREIFRELKPAALVLYIDNCYGDRDEEFKKIASSGGVTDVLYQHHSNGYVMPETKHSEKLSCYDKMAGNNKAFKSNDVSVILLRKPTKDTTGISMFQSPTVLHPEVDISFPEAELSPSTSTTLMFRAVEVESIPPSPTSTLPMVTPVEAESIPPTSTFPMFTAVEAESIPPTSTLPMVTQVEAESIPPTSTLPMVTAVAAESIPSRSTTPTVTTDNTSDVQDTDQVTTPLKLRGRNKPSSRFTPY